MGNIGVPYLCGGTFFVMLLQARAARSKARDKLSGGTDGLSDSDVLSGLIYVYTGNKTECHISSIRKATSEFKGCKSNGNTYVPFNASGDAENFNYAVKNNYSDILGRMSEFVEQYIDRNKVDRLVRAILEVIEQDSSGIPDETDFYVLPNGRPIKKRELLALDTIVIEAFLVGILHYIQTERHDNNINGQATIESWGGKTSSRAPRKFDNHVFGSSITRELKIDFCKKTASEETAQFSDEDGVLDFQPGKSHFLFGGQNIAPDLLNLTDGQIFLIDNDLVPGLDDSDDADEDELRQHFEVYLKKASELYGAVKTLLYSEQPRPFYDFYVCNDVKQRVYCNSRSISYSSYTYKTFKNTTAFTLMECSRFIILTGTGGLGKSMMLRHFMLDAIQRYDETNILPIFIQVKDFNDEYKSFVEYVYDTFHNLGGDISIDSFRTLLSVGRFLLLFDGLDEIHSSYREKFQKEMDQFTNTYSENMFVISSRPYSSFISFSRFTVLQLNPFTKAQALELIDKLDFRPDEPNIKRNFRKSLDSTLYSSHREFTENPLLLTIMLMTFEQYADIPQKMHIFYEEAFKTLAQKHDANKGGFKRDLKTGLTIEQFGNFFAEICSRTYHDEKFELTEAEFSVYFDLLNERKRVGDYSTNASDYLYDLCTNMCLMYFESGKYHFTHRSFQEYFCALYFSKQKDKNLQAIGNFFEQRRSRNYGDKTFLMLYDMIPEKVEEYIFTPYLSKLLSECDEADGYWSFLEIMYPHISYEVGETLDYDTISPSSYLYEFIRDLLFENRLDRLALPYYDEFAVEKYGYIENEGDHELVNLSDVSYEYIQENGEPDPVGWTLEIDIADLRKKDYRYKELVSLIEKDDFPLKVEYANARMCLEHLLDAQKPSGDDLFSLFS